MVLRGSATHPEKGVQDLQQALNTARAYLDQTEHELQEQREHVSADLKSVSLHEAKGKGDFVTKNEMADAIRALTLRLEELETKRTQAKKQVFELSTEMQRTLKQLLAGGMAGATARSIVAPIDRTKILLQTQHLTQGGAVKYTGIVNCFTTIVREEGARKLWRGNGTNCIRIFPYASLQFWSYDYYKGKIMDRSDNFGVIQRLQAGSMAGATAASLTYPLDVIRIRLAVQPELKGFADSCKSIWAENGVRSMYKGFVPTLLSLSPFIAINFCTFDQLKSMVIKDQSAAPNPLLILSLGAASGIFAQTICYPLDTVRRRMQLKGTKYTGVPNAFATILREESIRGFYKGILPNAVKVVPNNGIRFLAYTYFCRMLGVPPRKRKK